MLRATKISVIFTKNSRNFKNRYVCKILVDTRVEKLINYDVTSETDRKIVIG